MSSLLVLTILETIVKLGCERINLLSTNLLSLVSNKLCETNCCYDRTKNSS